MTQHDEYAWFYEEQKIVSAVYIDIVKSILKFAIHDIGHEEKALVSLLSRALKEAIIHNDLEDKIQYNEVFQSLFPVKVVLDSKDQEMLDEIINAGMETISYRDGNDFFYLKTFDTVILIVSCFPRSPLNEPELLEKALRERFLNPVTVYLDLAPSIGPECRFRRFLFNPENTPGFNPWDIQVIDTRNLPHKIKAFFKRLYFNTTIPWESEILRPLNYCLKKKPLLNNMP